MSANQPAGLREELSKVSISESINYLKNHLNEIKTVRDWADKMGYENAKSFSDNFRDQFRLRSQPVLMAYRVRKVVSLLREAAMSHYEIAYDFQLHDEKGLYQFIKNKTSYAPGHIKELSEQDYRRLIKRLEKNIIE